MEKIVFKLISKTLLIFAAISIITSCGDQKPKSQYLNEKITKNNLYDISQKISEENKMTREDIQLLTGAVNRLGVNADSIVGKSIGELINLQNDFLRQQEFKQMISILAKAEIIANHTIKYIGMKPLDTLGNSYDYLVFEITNNSEKSIKDLTGQFRFLDANGTIIKAYPIELAKVMTSPNELKPKETRRFVYPFFHDKSNQRDSIVRSTKGLQVVWFPAIMEYTDKTKISSVVE